MNWIQPMEPVVTEQIINREGWIHQIKWDGIRGMVYIEGGIHQIFTKKGNERTLLYPEFKGMTQQIKAYNAVLDGELVVFSDEDRPLFHRSLIRERVSSINKIDYYARRYPTVYILFDLLYYNDKNLTIFPLKERREMLTQIIITGPNLTITDDFSDGDSLYSFMKKKNWEGIVSKKLDSKYVTGKGHKSWYKRKIIKKLLAVVCGIQWKDNSPNSLILGILQEDSGYYFIGKASLGLSQEDINNLKEYASGLIRETCPLRVDVKIFKEKVTWLEPALTCWVSFLEWTNDGVLRHPKILGFSKQRVEEADGMEWSVDE